MAPKTRVAMTDFDDTLNLATRQLMDRFCSANGAERRPALGSIG
jgi:hypothetical protein